MRYYPDRNWTIPTSAIGVKQNSFGNFPTTSTWLRGITLASFFGPVAKLGAGSFYLSAYHDKSGERLSGSDTYRLHVPANVPASEFWAVTVYDLETEAFSLNRLTSRSILDKAVRKNADGTVDIYVGAKAPAGMESTGFMPRRERAGIRGFGSMARRRESSIKRGNCRTLKRSTDPSGWDVRNVEVFDRTDAGCSSFLSFL